MPSSNVNTFMPFRDRVNKGPAIPTEGTEVSRPDQEIRPDGESTPSAQETVEVTVCSRDGGGYCLFKRRWRLLSAQETVEMLNVGDSPRDGGL